MLSSIGEIANIVVGQTSIDRRRSGVCLINLFRNKEKQQGKAKLQGSFVVFVEMSKHQPYLGNLSRTSLAAPLFNFDRKRPQAQGLDLVGAT